MKKLFLITIFLASISFSFSQENNKKPYKLIMGARVNPLVIYDFDGNRSEAVRLHGEIGMLWNKRWYYSVECDSQKKRVIRKRHVCFYKYLYG